MFDFDLHAHIGKCDVCGKETKVAVCASSIGPISFAYCRSCLAAGAEPYEHMVSYVACAGKWPEEISAEAQAWVRRRLAFLNKTEDEFAQDVSECALALLGCC